MIINANGNHIQEIVDLGEKYFEQSRFAQYGEYNAQQAFSYIKGSIVDPLRYCDALVIDDVVEGFCVAHAGVQAWSSALMCNVSFIYVTPEQRGNGWETVFIERVEAWAKLHNMDEVLLGDYAMTPERTRILTERKGYDTVGYIGAKRIDV
jgi:GNAT superfamily N-acetyltransferase